MIKTFSCGICRKRGKKEFSGTRYELRKHLREEHGQKKELTNTISVKGEYKKQDWWIVHWCVKGW